MTREQKERKDQKTIQKYAEKMRKQGKAYMQTFSAFAINQRRSRAAAAGECVLQAMDAVRGLSRTKPLKDGTLDYMINEKKVQDPDGRKGFQYEITYRVVSYERAFTDDQIRKGTEELAEKLRKETEEMFAEDPAEDPGT